MKIKQKEEWNEEVNHTPIWRNRVPESGNSKYKRPKVGTWARARFLEHFFNSFTLTVFMISSTLKASSTNWNFQTYMSSSLLWHLPLAVSQAYQTWHFQTWIPELHTKSAPSWHLTGKWPAPGHLHPFICSCSFTFHKLDNPSVNLVGSLKQA